VLYPLSYPQHQHDSKKPPLPANWQAAGAQDVERDAQMQRLSETRRFRTSDSTQITPFPMRAGTRRSGEREDGAHLDRGGQLRRGFGLGVEDTDVDERARIR
jgi:hypothetical protein